MASSRKKRRGLSIAVIVVLCLLLIAVVAAAVGYSLVARRVKALQAGASFTLDYEITPTADSPALYGILQQAGATNGTVTGQYEPNALQLSIAAKKAVIPASLLGVGTEATSLQDVTEFQLDAKGLQRVQPESARDGYLYFQLNTGSAGTDAPVLVVGFQKDKFFDDAIPVELQLTIPAHDVTIRLSGTVSARTVSLTAPTSRMKDDDIQTLVQIRETIQSVLQFVQNAS